MKAALRELRDALSEMLRGRRSGVAAALLAAAGRTGNAAVQADAVRALASALAALQSAGGSAEGQVQLLDITSLIHIRFALDAIKKH